MSAAPAFAPPAAAPAHAPTVYAASAASEPAPSGSQRPARPPRFALSDVQESVIRLMAEGASAGEAATRAGVHRSTIYHWQRTNLLFATRLNESRHEVASHFRDQFHARADKALATIDRLLDDPATPAAVQARLALAILNAAASPIEPARILAQALDHSINAPMPGEDEDSRYRSSGLARQANDPAYRFHAEPEHEPESMEFPDEAGEQSANLRQNPTNPTDFSSVEAQRTQPAGEDEANATGQTVGHGPARSAQLKPQPIRRTEPKTSRNAPCPCGSGLKYKRCCL